MCWSTCRPSSPRRCEHGTLALETNVVVGKPARATPQVSAKIVEVNFYPTWSVPDIVAQNDLIPTIRKDPNYFYEQHFNVMRDWGSAAARSRLGRLGLAASGELQVPPGPRPAKRARRRAHQHAEQALRLYARHAAEAALFGQSARAFSSGCVRVEKVSGAGRLAARRPEGLDA